MSVGVHTHCNAQSVGNRDKNVDDSFKKLGDEMEEIGEVYNYGFFIFHQLFEDNILLDTGFHCCFEKYAFSLITICLFVCFCR